MDNLLVSGLSVAVIVSIIFALHESNRLAEQRLKDETTKAESRLAESLATADQRKKGRNAWERC